MFDEVSEILGQTPLSFTTIVAEHLRNAGIKSVGLLASPLTIRSKLYHKALGKDVLVTCLKSTQQNITEAIIRSVIANRTKPMEPSFTDQIAMLSANTDRVLLGCTELSVLAEKVQNPNHIDPLLLVVEKIFLDETKV